MTVANNYNPVRQLGNGVTTDFSFNFRVLEDEQIVVYELPEGGEQQVVDSSEYTVNLTNSGGNVVFNTAPANGTVIVITRLTPQTQETPYKTSQGFPAAVVEGDFDKLTMMVQELQQDSDRSVKVDVTSGVTPDVLVNQVERIYESVDNIDTVADDISNVNTTAGSIASVNTTAGSIANVNTVAGIASDVATVAAISSDVSGVAGISTEVSGVYYSRGAVENVANNVNDVVNVSDNVLFVQTAANNISNINTVGNNISDVNTTAGSIANVNAVAGDLTNIDAVAGDLANINAVAGNASNINAVATNITNVNAVGAVADDLQDVIDNEANINIVAGSINDVAAVGAIAQEVSGVYDNEANINAVYADLANINIVAGISQQLSPIYPVVEPYVNGSNWYRICSDGWVEQGGLTSSGTSVTVNFLKPFANTSFTIIGIKNRSAASGNPVSVSAVTTTSATFATSGDGSPVYWEAKGYGA